MEQQQQQQRLWRFGGGAAFEGVIPARLAMEVEEKEG
jgi:hypothetical protein